MRELPLNKSYHGLSISHTHISPLIAEAVTKYPAKPYFMLVTVGSIVDKGATLRLSVQIEKKIGIINMTTEIVHDFLERGGDEWIYGLALKYWRLKDLRPGRSGRSFHSAPNQPHLLLYAGLQFRFGKQATSFIMESLGGNHETVLR